MSGVRKSSRTAAKSTATLIGAPSDSKDTAIHEVSLPKKASRVKSVFNTPVVVGLEDHNDEAPEAKPVRKTKKKVPPPPSEKTVIDPKWKHTRGKRGLLKEVVDFPIDILYEATTIKELGHARTLNFTRFSPIFCLKTYCRCPELLRTFVSDF